MAKHRIGLYPGTFDPVTFGHIDIITRAMTIVDHLVVAVATNEGKGPLYQADRRVELVEAEMEGLRARGHSIEVRSFDTLLMNFATRSMRRRTELMFQVVILRGISDSSPPGSTRGSMRDSPIKKGRWIAGSSPAMTMGEVVPQNRGWRRSSKTLSFRGADEVREPGIHTPQHGGLWIPGPALRAVPE